MNIKRALSIILVLSGMMTFSQSKNSLDLKTEGGYEYNYFKSPKEILMNGDLLTEKDLISSSLFQEIGLDYDYQYRWKNNRIKVSVNPAAKFFYENIDDSFWSLKLKTKYYYKFNKNTVFFLEGKLLRMDREGLGGDQDVLINPLGYLSYGATSGIEFEPFRDNELTVEGFYNFKNFDTYGVRDLQFNEYGIQLSSVQTFEKNHLKHQLGITTFFKKRLYDTYDASDAVANGERDWDYISGKLFYKLPFSKNFEVKPNLAYYVRIDNSIGRSGFNQYGPGISMKYDNSKTKIRTTVSYITRKYTDIEARDSDGRIGEKIKYGYANFGLHAAHKIFKNTSLIATLYSKVRSTNYTDLDARSFRNYRNQYAGMGILWEL